MTIDTFLTQLAEHCGIATSAVEVIVDEDDEAINVQMNLPEADSGLFIGYHGETLDSIQRILRIVFQRETDKRINLNINEYRQQREEKVKEMARNAAKRVQETNSPYTFTYHIPSHERFVVHTTVSDEFPDLESVSNGDGRDRKLTIQRKKED